MTQIARPDQIDELTSLRFFAAMAILIFHFYYGYEGYALAEAVVSRLYLGVDLFFILSGFILMHVYQDRVLDDRFRFSDFIVNRFARVYPLHLVTLLAALVVILNAPSVGYDKFWYFIANLLLVHAWGTVESTSYNAASWSISAEFMAYLTFYPLACVVLTMRRVTALILAVAILSTVAWVAVDLGMHRPSVMTFDNGIVHIMPEFFLGMTIYRFRGKLQVLRRQGRAIFGLLVLAVALRMVNSERDVITILLFGGIILVVSEMSLRPGAGLLRAPALVYLGEISYAIYMVHTFALWIAMDLVDDIYAEAWVFVAYALGSLVAAALLHGFVEVPARGWIRAVYRGRRPAKRAAGV